jgi:peptidoglycan LD-endopeptidase LytH
MPVEPPNEFSDMLEPRFHTARRALLLALGAGTLIAAPLASQTATLAVAALQLASETDEPSAEPSHGNGLLIPVVGISPDELRDSYSHARSGGRVHDAIDIHAPRGTPVIAVADGEIIRLHSGARGGLSVYHLDDDGRTRYYYAHLDHYAEGLRAGNRVRRGDVIGYVGDTGNAQPGDHHLHFAVAVLSSRSRWWEGRNLNPYNLLRASR